MQFDFPALVTLLQRTPLGDLLDEEADGPQPSEPEGDPNGTTSQPPADSFGPLCFDF